MNDERASFTFAKSQADWVKKKEKKKSIKSEDESATGCTKSRKSLFLIGQRIKYICSAKTPLVKISIIACDKMPSSDILLYGALTKTKRAERHHDGTRSCVIAPDIAAQPSFFLLEVYCLFASIQLCVKVCIAWQKSWQFGTDIENMTDYAKKRI